MNKNTRHFKTMMMIASATAFTPLLLILFYITGLNLLVLVNLTFVFIVLFAFMVQVNGIVLNSFSNIFLFFILINIFKIFIFASNDVGFERSLLLTHFFGLIMPFIMISFFSKFGENDKDQIYEILEKFSWRYLSVAGPLIVVYSILYSVGAISYFGLSVGLHYCFPFFLRASKKIYTPIFLILVLMTGKRAGLVNLLSQIAINTIGNIKRKPVPVFLTALIVLGAIFYVLKYTILLRRFTAIFEYGVDFLDPYFLIIAFGGRFEEISGILDYFQNNPGQFLFGAPPGTYYTWFVQYSQYEELKNYAHFTPVGMIFRYGLVFTVFIYGLFTYTLFKRWAPNDPVFLVCVSIFVGSFFGANLIIDPITWIFWSLLICVGPKYYK